MNSKRHIPVSDVDLNGNERRYLLEAFDSGWISGSGPFVDRFEEAFAQFIGVDHAVSCVNGTVALHLALLALGVGPGDEVIVPSLTYIATANAVSYCGATPVFADSDPDSWNLTADTVLPRINRRTKGIIVVHLYGNPVDMDPIKKIAQENSLFVVEDAAEAHGATYKKNRVGSIGDISTFSFYGNKIMTTGEGGMVVTSDLELAKKARLLRGQGMDPDKRFWFPEIGYNYRLTNLQCAIGLAQLERIDEYLAARLVVAKCYRSKLEGAEGVTLQIEKEDGSSAWWMFSILVDSESKRDHLIEELQKEKIETRPIFYPLHVMPSYCNLDANCQNAERIGLTGINLPSGAHVSKTDIDKISDLIIEILRRH